MFRVSAIHFASLVATVVASLVINVSSARAASPDPSSLTVAASDLARSRLLVQQLGSEEFTEREEAEESLEKMGRLARLALLEGVNTDPNPEVRTRCAALLPRASSLDLTARLEVFLADTEGRYQHDLPGWNQFRSIAAQEWKLLGFVVNRNRPLEKAARSVFVDLMTGAINRSLLLSVSLPPAELSAVVVARRQELYFDRFGRLGPGRGEFTVTSRERHDPSAEDIAALLFAESLAPQVTARLPRQNSSVSLIQSSSFCSQILREDSDKGLVYKAIAAAWLETRFNPADQYYGMSLATELNMTEQAIRLAARLFNNPVSPIQYRAQAASTISRYGTKEHIPLLEKAFEDNGVMNAVRGGRGGGFGVSVNGPEVQVRDAALAIAIQLAGQSPEDYGFNDQQRSGTPGVSYSYTRYYLSEDQRAAAFDQWNEWWSRNKDR